MRWAAVKFIKAVLLQMLSISLLGGQKEGPISGVIAKILSCVEVSAYIQSSESPDAG